MQVHNDHFYTYEELQELLLAAQEAHPELCKLTALEKTPGGRTIWSATLSTAPTAEEASQRPAFYVQGGLHAEEGMGITASLAFLYTMLEQESARKLLETVTVYITPCINPDGCNTCVTTGMDIRSMVEKLPDGTPNALIAQDLDGDGKILTMRWEDPTGEWKMAPGCGNLMVLRQPGDTEGPFYHVCTEGLVANYNGSGPVKPMRRLDMNRQFAGNWKDTNEGGDYPGRHVETRAVMEFLLSHPNIFACFDIHCGTRALIVDMTSNPSDNQALREMMALCKEITGIEPVAESNYGRALDAAPTVLPGVFRGYAQDTFGLLGATVELGNGWNSAGYSAKEVFEAPKGIMCEEMIAKIMALHEKHDSQIAAPWVPYDHPQLGKVEIGGHIHGNAYFMLAQDMLELIPKVTLFLQQIMQWHPRLDLVNVKAEPMGGDVVRVRADVINTGKLSTTVLKSAAGFHARYPVYLTVSGGEEMLSGIAKPQFAGLDPLEYQRVEWFVRAKPGTELTVTASHPKAGETSVQVTV